MKGIERIRGWRKYYLIIILPVMLVVIFYSIYTDTNKYEHLNMVVKSTEVDVIVKKTNVDRTVVILNDTLMIPTYTRLAKSYKNDTLTKIRSSKFNISKMTVPYLLT